MPNHLQGQFCKLQVTDILLANMLKYGNLLQVSYKRLRERCRNIFDSSGSSLPVKKFSHFQVQTNTEKLVNGKNFP